MTGPPQEPIAADADPIETELALIDAKDVAEPAHRTIFRRMARNVGWLLGGRGFQGVTSLFYVALSARILGPAMFGTFTLILSYAQTIANVASFQSWQTVIRYGSLHLATDERDKLERLLGLTAVLDLAAALLGALVGAACVSIVAPRLGWQTGQEGPAAAFTAALLLSTGSTPSGMLRLADRVNLLTLAEAMAPGVRLVGSLIAWATGAGLKTFLFVWSVSALLQLATTWAVALLGTDMRPRIAPAAFRRALGENGGIVRFLVNTNLSASLGVFSQIGTLAVGGVAGPTAAGGISLAQKLARTISKPVQTVAHVLYSELAGLVAGKDRSGLRLVLGRMTLGASGLAVVMMAILVLASSSLLLLVTGQSYEFARPFLIAYGIAAAIDICGFALEPLHNAMGRAGRVLGARALAAGAYYIGLIAFLPAFGAMAAALAAIVSAMTMRGRLAYSAIELLRGKDARSRKSA